jgi:hypothetical protein
VPASPDPSKTNAAAIIALVVGLASVVIVLFVSIPIGAIMGLIAVGVGNYGRQQARTQGAMPLAIAGMVLGWGSVGLQLYAAIAD